MVYGRRGRAAGVVVAARRHLNSTRAPSARITSPTPVSAAALEPAGQFLLERDQREPDDQQRRRVADAPPGAEPGRGPHVALVGGDQRGDRDEVVGVGGVPQPEHERDRQRHQQRRALDQVREPVVERLDRLEQAGPSAAPPAPRQPPPGRTRSRRRSAAAARGRARAARARASRAAVRSSSRRFWNDAAGRGRPCRARARRRRRAQASAVASASAWWKRVATTPARHAARRRRAASARDVSRASSTPAPSAGSG